MLCILVLSNACAAAQALDKYFGANSEPNAYGKAIIDEINSFSGTLPQAVKTTFGNERINCQIRLFSGETVTIGIVTKGAKISEAKSRAVSSPNFLVRTDEATLRRIAYSQLPVFEAVNSIKNGKISIEAVGGWMPRIRLWLFWGLLKTTDGIENMTAKIILFRPKWW